MLYQLQWVQCVESLCAAIYPPLLCIGRRRVSAARTAHSLDKGFGFWFLGFKVEDSMCRVQ